MTLKEMIEGEIAMTDEFTKVVSHACAKFACHQGLSMRLFRDESRRRDVIHLDIDLAINRLDSGQLGFDFRSVENLLITWSAPLRSEEEFTSGWLVSARFMLANTSVAFISRVFLTSLLTHLEQCFCPKTYTGPLK